MENQLLFDKLAYVDRLIKSGIDEGQARALSDALDEALKESVATKNDIASLRNDLYHKIEVEIRDLKIWVGSIAVLLFGALVAVRFFVR
jgi:hypothetical protein